MWVSYSLWREFSPQSGFEELHCHRKRGFNRARRREPQIEPLTQQDNIPQRVGKLAQQAVVELHNFEPLARDAISEVARDRLHLEREPEEVQSRVLQVMERYLEHPFLRDRQVVYLDRGTSKPQEFILENQGEKIACFYLFDCLIEEDTNTLHVIDFKTGQKDKQEGEERYDLRQAFMYLLACRSHYPEKRAIASFYNLETGRESAIYSATESELELVQLRLAEIARQHEQQQREYRRNPARFHQLYPATPGKACKNCPYTSVCEDYDPEPISDESE